MNPLRVKSMSTVGGGAKKTDTKLVTAQDWGGGVGLSFAERSNYLPNKVSVVFLSRSLEPRPPIKNS